MSGEHVDVWVCPTCLETFGPLSARSFMVKDPTDGELICCECRKANFSEFERWSPLLTREKDEEEDEDDWVDGSGMSWACANGMFRTWGANFQQAVEDREFLELYLVGRIADGKAPIPQDYRLASRCPGDQWSRIGIGIYRTLEYSAWLDGFGPDVTRVWIRLEEEHYSS